jgi:hypothetical protein
MATSRGLFPTGTVATTVFLEVAITETFEGLIRDVDVRPVRGDGDPKGAPPRPWPPPCWWPRVDHRDIVGASVRDIGVFPVRGDGDPIGVTPHRDRGHHRVAGRSITETVLELLFAT